MAADATLSAQTRTEFGKGAARRLRRAGQTPAVLYGHGTDPVHLALPAQEVFLALRTANALLEITVDGQKKPVLALPKQIQRDPMGFQTGSEAGYWIWESGPKGIMTKIGRGYSPSSDWNLTGPILAQMMKGHQFFMENDGGNCHVAYSETAHDNTHGYGPTPQIALLRCHIAFNLRQATAEVPNDLCGSC